MTESEAIEKLRAYLKCQSLQVKGIYEECNYKLCDDCDLCYAQGNTQEHIKSIEIAIQALEKKIPKKPIYIANLGYAALWLCPVCERRIVRSDLKYCHQCGQKLDWRDENEID